MLFCNPSTVQQTVNNRKTSCNWTHQLGPSRTFGKAFRCILDVNHFRNPSGLRCTCCVEGVAMLCKRKHSPQSHNHTLLPLQSASALQADLGRRQRCKQALQAE
jgi:hypothetical protein